MEPLSSPYWRQDFVLKFCISYPQPGSVTPCHSLRVGFRNHFGFCFRDFHLVFLPYVGRGFRICLLFHRTLIHSELFIEINFGFTFAMQQVIPGALSAGAWPAVGRACFGRMSLPAVSSRPLSSSQSRDYCCLLETERRHRATGLNNAPK